jgi:lysophospholipase L1-like esterase
MGSQSFKRLSQALAHGRLNLGAWHGFHELVYCEPLDIEGVAFDFSLPKSSYFALLFEKNEAGSRGIRLSNDNRFANLIFSAQSDGEFVWTATLPSLPVRTDQWNHLQLTRGEKGPQFSLNGAGVEVPDLALPAGAWNVGFRGCFGNVWIDNIKTIDRSGHRHTLETFSNRKHWLAVYGLALVGVLLADTLLTVLQRALRVSTNNILLSATVLNLIAAFLSAMCYPVLWHYQERYPSADLIPQAVKDEATHNDLASVRKRLQDLMQHDGDQEYRILFLGTSQTRGGNASKPTEGFVSRIRQRLLSVAKDGLPYGVINGAVSGSNTTLLVPLYEQELLPLKPKVLVVNLGYNDQSVENFPDNLRHLAAISRAHGVKVFFALEACCADTVPDELPTHQAMREVAREFGIPIIDCHGYLKQFLNRGFLWWDFVHATSYGHRLIAEYIYAALAKDGIVPAA